MYVFKEGSAYYAYVAVVGVSSWPAAQNSIARVRGSMAG